MPHLPHIRSAQPQPRHLSSDLSSFPERIRLRRGSVPSNARRSAALAPLQALRSLHAPDDALVPRQSGNQVFVIPASYKGINDGPAAGVVVGITLGTVLGFLLVIWLVFVLINANPSNNYIEGDEVDINITRNHGARTHRTRTHRSTHRTARTEMSDHRSQAASSHHTQQPSRSPAPAPAPQRTERILVEETRRRTERSQPPPPRSPSSARHTERQSERISIHEREERRVAGDDVVEVIEEHSEVTPEEPRRSGSKKPTNSGFRPVDPNEYGGGNFPQRNIDRSRSKR